MSGIRRNFAARLALILLTFALISVTLCSATLQMTVNNGRIVQVQFPQNGMIVDMDGVGTIGKISLTSLPITAAIDGVGNILQANGQGTVYYYEYGKIKQIGDVYLYYYGEGMLKQIADLYLYYYGDRKAKQIGDVYLYYYGEGMLKQIADLYLYYYGDGNLKQIGDVYLYYYGDGKVKQIGDIYIYYYGDGSFKETSGSDSRVQLSIS